MNPINKIVYLAGWNTPDSFMKSWMLPLAKDLGVGIEPLPYPGYGAVVIDLDRWDIDLLINRWAPMIDENTLVVGWSLGGMLALKLAQQVACAGVVTLASNVSFQGDSDWQMPSSQYDSFLKRFKRFPDKTERAFWQLQVSGAQKPEDLLVLLEQHRQGFDADHTSLLESLQLLGRLNLQATNPNCPQLSLFANSDALVPVCAAKTMKTRFPEAWVRVIDGSHCMVENPQIFIEIKNWIETTSGQNGALLHHE